MPRTLPTFHQAGDSGTISRTLIVKKPTSYGPQVTALRNKTGYDYANFYRREFKIDEEEYGKPYQRKKVEPLSDEELHALKLKKKG